ncbi:hypothetical protein NC653_010101 [Populus alba x Populus x berolinensis]|uniref:Uncharacterized protein n=1 Tax=Populus alba x Populus x berolinensis TaxID=444605 RepID=A0AAD6QYZ7_9ROSI|nr:hypothetical protein NC653_010101 [Populus alba x Populus x berolinensis]
MLVECVSQTFAMTGALAWQVKKPNKKRFFWVLKGEMARDYLFIYFARLSPFCVMGSFFPSLSLNLLRIPITLHHTRNSRHQQESALPTTSIHHPKNVFGRPITPVSSQCWFLQLKYGGQSMIAAS